MPEPLVEPIPGHPAVVARTSRRGSPERSLIIVSYHVGIEAGLRYERGAELPSEAAVCRERLPSPPGRIDADRLAVLGDLGHRIGSPDGDEAEKLRDLAIVVTNHVELAVVPGNHGGGLADFFDDNVKVTDPGGIRLGDMGFCRDHTWPSREVFATDVVCSTHEHPAIRLEGEIGGARKRHAWLRGALAPEVFTECHEAIPAEVARADAELVVFPAFNGTPGEAWVNIPEQGFLSPFLPDGLANGEAYPLDGTRLGDYRNA